MRHPTVPPANGTHAYAAPIHRIIIQEVRTMDANDSSDNSAPSDSIQGDGGPAAPGLTRRSVLARSGLAAGGALLGAAALKSASVASAASEVTPAPPSIGAAVPLTYFGPSPSQVQKELVGPLQLLRTGEIDFNAGTITIPLYKGQTRNGKVVWYVLTDTSDKDNADALGLLHSAKLRYANVGRAVRPAQIEKDTSLTFFRGAVDFRQERKVTPGAEPNPFPPASFQPGAIGDNNYSPLIVIKNAGNHVYNAPIVAFDVDASQIEFPNGDPDYARVHDKVVKISPKDGTVTLDLVPGFSFAKPVLYLSLDASAALPASIEGVTLAPGLNDITLGHDDSAFSAVERLFAMTNGPRGKDNPQRQGFNSALAGEGKGPLNALGGIPTVATDYSPLWDVNVGEWSKEAIDKGYRSRVTEEFQILGLVQGGHITGPGGKPFGSAGFIVNCPVVHRFL